MARISSAAYLGSDPIKLVFATFDMKIGTASGRREHGCKGFSQL
jgi:hypothetical protein